ncbi:ribokinase [Sporosarcina saromensis]|uniref:Ribokinase n=1 Tax=Sporosarcina saromensis TaxID=359365 RepID=A0ABU4GDX6_9BACL|nr:ribokinase [Sporosarcina saromensis]MDW0115186.1 ribokinase [Sporosarcina saromensis]
MNVSNNIVVVGSMNMDIVMSAERLPKIGETILGEKVVYLPGGKGANQAVCMARLQGDVTMVGAVGNDEFGRSLKDQMESNGVKTDFIRVVDGVQTGIANIFHVNRDNCITVIPGANYTVTKERITKEVVQAIAAADVLVVQLEIPLETVQYVLGIAKQHGVKTILNPAPAQFLSPELLSLVDYLTPNETEFELLTGEHSTTDEELSALMLKWESTYHHTLIVTLGERGCAILEDGQLVVTPPPKVEVVDTTGAGDSFNGALAVGISTGQSLKETVDFAVKVSALAVTKFGAQEGMPFYEDIH